MFLLMGLLDHARSRIMARVGARLQAALDARVLDASFRRLALAPQDVTALAAQRDLDAVARLWASPAVLALFDLPWTPLFFAALFVFHPLLGWTAVAGGLILVLISWANQRSCETPLNNATLATLASDRQGEALKCRTDPGAWHVGCRPRPLGGRPRSGPYPGPCCSRRSRSLDGSDKDVPAVFAVGHAGSGRIDGLAGRTDGRCHDRRHGPDGASLAAD